MNYYEHHLGDYDAATSHLSWLEDCAYSRLMRLYYRTEAPIPADIKQACRLVRAASKQERDAVQQVLSEFFELRDDGWHQHRCDADIERFREAEPDREAKRENTRERQRRTRERRKELFDALRGHGVVPAFDTKTSELEAQLSRVTSHPVTRDITVTDASVTRDATATQSPDPRHQYPEGAGGGTSLQPPTRTPTRAGQACLRMRAAGLQAVSPSHPRLLVLLDAGITDDELAEAAKDAADKGKPFAYALATAEGRRRDAAATPALPAAPEAVPPSRDNSDFERLKAMEAERAARTPEQVEAARRIREAALSAVRRPGRPTAPAQEAAT